MLLVYGRCHSLPSLLLLPPASPTPLPSEDYPPVEAVSCPLCLPAVHACGFTTFRLPSWCHPPPSYPHGHSAILLSPALYPLTTKAALPVQGQHGGTCFLVTQRQVLGCLDNDNASCSALCAKDLHPCYANSAAVPCVHRT